ncbi:MAG: hypothetical protein R6V31_11450, partial [Halohasta sp.]
GTGRRAGGGRRVGPRRPPRRSARSPRRVGGGRRSPAVETPSTAGDRRRLDRGRSSATADPAAGSGAPAARSTRADPSPLIGRATVADPTTGLSAGQRSAERVMPLPAHRERVGDEGTGVPVDRRLADETAGASLADRRPAGDGWEPPVVEPWEGAGTASTPVSTVGFGWPSERFARTGVTVVDRVGGVLEAVADECCSGDIGSTDWWSETGTEW